MKLYMDYNRSKELWCEITQSGKKVVDTFVDTVEDCVDIMLYLLGLNKFNCFCELSSTKNNLDKFELQITDEHDTIYSYQIHERPLNLYCD